MTKKHLIVTHSGGFHADDTFGVAALMLLLGEGNMEIVRSRDPEIIAKGDYVLDTGNVYDPSANRFDHHQQGGAGKRDNGIPYASFGLIWKHFGEQIAGSKAAADAIDRRLVQPIDAFDNGVELFTRNDYDVSPYTVQNVFFAFEPAWGEKASYDQDFSDAVGFAKRILSREILQEQQNVKASEIVQKAYEDAPDKRLVVIESEPVIRRNVITESLSSRPEPLYFVRKHEDAGKWQVVCVMDDIRSFKNRKDLPAAWAGKRDDELAAVTGVADAVFCHSGRFICVANSKEGALKLAELALAK
ncbi:MAG TPA: MYG1 family protein [Candidatus Paceibacterota bacterium]|nr:MYG1 family protein [Candidatus Paceibacterota bacterium]